MMSRQWNEYKLVNSYWHNKTAQTDRIAANVGGPPHTWTGWTLWEKKNWYKDTLIDCFSGVPIGVIDNGWHVKPNYYSFSNMYDRKGRKEKLNSYIFVTRVWLIRQYCVYSFCVSVYFWLSLVKIYFIPDILFWKAQQQILFNGLK